MKYTKYFALVFFFFTLGAQDILGPTELCPKRMVGLKYPRLAHYFGAQGKVELEAIVSSEGSVEKVNAISGHVLLLEVAKDSLAEWRFSGCSPTAAPCRYKVTFVFELKGGSCVKPQCPNEVEIDLPLVTIRSQLARAETN